MTSWTLPETVEVAGKACQINADYRDILDILSRMNNPEEPMNVRLMVSLTLFYEDFQKISPIDYPEAWKKLCWFINGGEEESNSRPSPKRIDWDQDQPLIVADINRVAGCEVRALPFLHWWTFLACFRGIGEGQLSTVVGIREKRRKGKKLDNWERDFYRENRAMVDFQTHYTPEEDEILKKWLGEG